jgi:hypothetical protein
MDLRFLIQRTSAVTREEFACSADFDLSILFEMLKLHARDLSVADAIFLFVDAPLKMQKSLFGSDL